MDPSIDEYIRANRDKYTRQAIREQLLAAGHDIASVDAALAQVGPEGAAATSLTPVGWRVGRRAFLALIGAGAIGAALVWNYGGLNVIAVPAYLIAGSIGLLVGRGLSRMVDRGSAVTVAVVLALMGGAFGLVVWSLLPPASAGLGPYLGAAPLLGGLAVIAFVGAAVAILVLRRSDATRAGMVGAAIPLLLWLVVTGTCYAPFLSNLGR